MFQKIDEAVEILLGLRKFIVMMSLIIIGVVFRVKNYLAGEEFVELLKATSIAFMASNSIERIGETIKSYIDSKGNKVQEITTELNESDDSK